MKEIDLNIKQNKQLIDAFLIPKTTKEMTSFICDIMTEKEIKELSNRLEAARLLTKNVQYCGIIEQTGLSSTTIARISKWLKGPLGGYRLILNRLSNHHTHSQNSAGKGLSLYS